MKKIFKFFVLILIFTSCNDSSQLTEAGNKNSEPPLLMNLLIENWGPYDSSTGISGDFEFRFIDKDAFNISFTIGERTHNLLDINNERYFSLKLNLENVEKWLIKGED